MKFKAPVYITMALVLFYLSETNAYAQGKAMVLTRRIERQFAADKMPYIFMNTERGIISIKGWDRPEVMVKLKLSARNADIDLARKELDYMKFNMSKTRNTIFINNWMLLPQPNVEISSIILAEYEIFVPRETEINLDNRLGKVEIEDVNGVLTGELHYNDLTLNRKLGGISVLIVIGDFNCTGSVLNGTVETRHSNVSILETTGNLGMKTEYGNLRTAFANGLFRFSLHSNATNINIENNLCHPLTMNLAGSYCPLKISDRCYTPVKQYLESDFTGDSDQQEWKLIYLPPDKASKLNINARFGTLNLF